MCLPIGWGFCAVWPENEYTLCPFLSGIGYGFRGKYGVCERIYTGFFKISFRFFLRLNFNDFYR